MKKTLLMTAALLALTAGLASAAGGLNLSWKDCGAFGFENQSFACNTNTTNAANEHVFVVSYVAPTFVDSANGTAAQIDLQSDGALLPEWWKMVNTGTCRSLALSESYLTSSWSCFDYWGNQTGGGATGGKSYVIPAGGNTARLNLACAIPTTKAGPIADGTETSMASVRITNTKTMGTTGCAGCLDGVCIVLNAIRITQNQYAPGGAKFIGIPAERNWISWQAGVPNCGNPITPTKNRTWGTVKALYR
jgi:uncharacterized membrane protein